MITIIDYKSGNLKSVCQALDRLAVEYVVSADPDSVRRASKIIFPGQGAAAQAMNALANADLIDVLKQSTVPFLGICIGMQLLYDGSDENSTDCLGIVSGRLARFASTTLTIPQIGWNLVKFSGHCPLFNAIPDESYFYFANSYSAPLSDVTVGIGFYGEPFTAVLQQGSYFGTQFHPEKSGKLGLQLLANFVEL